MAKKILYDNQGKEVVVEVPDEVTIASLGAAITDIQRSFSELRQAVEEQRGASTFDAEGAVKAAQAQIEALRSLINDHQTQRRGGDDLKNPELMTVSSGPYRGRKYADCAKVFNLLNRYSTDEARKLMSNRVDYVLPSDALRKVADEFRTYTTVDTGAGLEWMPAGNMQGSIWEDVYLSTEVISQFPVIRELPTDPFEISLDLDDSGDDWLQLSEAVDIPVSDADTRDLALRTTELGNAKRWSKRFEENALFAMLPIFEAYLRRTAREMMDKFMMNADKVSTATGSINSDDQAPSSSAYYLVGAQHNDGLRKLAIIDNTAQLVNAGGDGLQIGDMNNALSKLGKYASRSQDVRIFTDVYTWINGMGALEQVQTIDKYGPKATIHTGEVLKFKNSPVIVTGAIKKTEADGKLSATAANNTLGQIVMTNVNSWLVGFKRGLTIESEYRPVARAIYLIGTFRMGVVCFGTRSSAIHTSVIRNILV